MILTDNAIRQQALDPRESFIVQAPAGSGKTHLLVQRFLTLLAEAEHPGHILAITFTRKAAEEMKERIKRWLSDPTPNPWLAAIQKRIQDKNWLPEDLHDMQIMTIDSFCKHVVSLENPSVDIHPLPESCYDAAIHAFLDDPRFTDDQKPLWRWVGGDPNRLYQALFELLRERLGWAYHLLQTDTQDIVPNTHDSCERLAKWTIQEVIAQREFVSSLQEFLHELSQVTDSHLPVCHEHASIDEWRQCAAWLLTQKGTPRKKLTTAQGMPNKKMVCASTHEHLTALWQQIYSLISGDELLCKHLYHIRMIEWPGMNGAQEELLKALRTIAPGLLSHLHHIFTQKNTADFSELLIQAKNLLLHSDTVKEHMYQTVRHLLVDECQDTSPAQFDLIHALIEDWDNSRTLFLVGDPQQSIYRFRYADVRQFLHVQAHGMSHRDLTPLYLTNNLRTSAELLNAFNQLFSSIFSSKACINYGMMPHHNSHPVISNPGSLQTYWHDTPCEHAILDLVKNTSPDESVCILVRKRSQAKQLIQLLEQENIVFDAPDMFPSLQHEVFSNILELTVALADPTDKKAWYTVLSNNQAALDLSELTAIESQRPSLFDVHFFAALPPSIFEKTSFWHDILVMINQSPEWPLGQKVWQAAHHAGMLSGLPLSLIDEIYQWCELISNLELKHHITGDRYLFTSLAQKQLLSHHHPQSRIHIMTIHHAKGLEFDHVICPYLDSYSLLPDADHIYHNNFYDHHGLFHIMVPKNSWQYGDHMLDWYRWINKCQTDQEEIRLVYVALTRAKKSCVLMGKSDAPSQSWAARLKELLPNNSCQFGSNTDHNHIPRARKQYPHKPLSTFPAVIKPWHMTVNCEKATLGTIIHDALYRKWLESGLTWTQLFDKHQLRWRYIAMQQLGSSVIISEVSSLLKQFHDRPVLKTLLTHHHTFDKAEWLVCDDAGTEYVIDRIFIKDDRLFIIDYKMTYHHDLHDNYQSQLRNYMSLCASISPTLPRTLAIYDITHDQLRTIKLT